MGFNCFHGWLVGRSILLRPNGPLSAFMSHPFSQPSSSDFGSRTSAWMRNALRCPQRSGRICSLALMERGLPAACHQ